MADEANETYLGDGVYISYDGWQFRLRVNREAGDHVYLDPVVAKALVAT
jgi:hypothetical protein